MNPMVRVILSALLFGDGLEIALGQAAAVSTASVPVVTVCEALNDLSQYNGKAVVIVGRFGSTMEGSWLSENCERKIVTDGYTWDNIISTAYIGSEVERPPRLPRGFTWDRKLLTSKLKVVQTTTKLRVLKEYNYTDKWVAIFGRFEARLPLRVWMSGGRIPRGYGFGHEAAAPAQLISGDDGFKELKVKEERVSTPR